MSFIWGCFVWTLLNPLPFYIPDFGKMVPLYVPVLLVKIPYSYWKQLKPARMLQSMNTHFLNLLPKLLAIHILKYTDTSVFKILPLLGRPSLILDMRKYPLPHLHSQVYLLSD